MMMKRMTWMMPAAALMALTLACGGGGSDSPKVDPKPSLATRLVFTSDPTATAADWRLVADTTASQGGTVVLKLVGPTGAKAKGASIFLRLDGDRASWQKPSGATDPYVQGGAALNLTQGPDAAVQLVRSKLVAASNDLQAGAFQKTGAATLGDQPVMVVSLSMKSGLTPGVVSLVATPGKTGLWLDDQGVERPITLKVGSLNAE